MAIFFKKNYVICCFFSFQQTRHAEIFEKYSKDIDCYENENEKSNVVKKTDAKISKKRKQADDDNNLNPQSKRRKISEIPNHEEMSPTSIVSERKYAKINLLIDDNLKIKKEPFVEEIDMSELFGGFEPRQNSDWQQPRVEIVREEPELGEFVKDEPQCYDEYGTLNSIGARKNSYKFIHNVKFTGRKILF